MHNGDNKMMMGKEMIKEVKLREEQYRWALMFIRKIINDAGRKGDVTRADADR